VTLAGPALAAAGDLDTTFGGDGKVTTGFAGHAFVGGAAIQADGKIVAAGDVRTPSGEFMFALARYRPNGRLDDTFGGDGKVTTGFAGQAFAESVAIQDDGKILAAGRFNPDPGNGRFALVRYQPSGALDDTFGGDGKVTTGFAEDVGAAGVAVQADGKIVAAGTLNTTAGRERFALARYKPSGGLDDTFGGDGRVTTGFPGHAAARDVAIQADGNIVAAGRFFRDGGTERFALVGYQPSGELDDTFGGNGKVTTGFAGSESAEAVDIAIQTDGKIVAGGDVLRPSGEFHFALARYKPSGGLDDTFGGDGKVTTEFAESDSARAHGVAIQADGNIVAAGGVETETPSLELRFALARYRPGGRLDDTFGGDGRVTTGFTGRAVARGVAIQADGKILAAGTEEDFALARYLA
jgi:uncharacterized delta-60 repeat protein